MKTSRSDASLRYPDEYRLPYAQTIAGQKAQLVRLAKLRIELRALEGTIDHPTD